MAKRRKTSITTIKETVRMGGFTIVELLIATSVFSIVLLGALAGFIRTGQLFYKGVTITNTQSIAKDILDDVSNSLSATSSDKILLYTHSGQGSNGYDYDCIGNVRYTYTLNKMVDFSLGTNLSAGGNYGVLRNVVNGCSAPTQASLANATEMLGDHMRVSDFTISPPNAGKVYTVTVTLAYGTDDVLSQTNPPSCVGDSQSQQFCAVSNLSTSVFAEF